MDSPEHGKLPKQGEQPQVFAITGIDLNPKTQDKLDTISIELAKRLVQSTYPETADTNKALELPEQDKEDFLKDELTKLINGLRASNEQIHISVANQISDAISFALSIKDGVQPKEKQPIYKDDRLHHQSYVFHTPTEEPATADIKALNLVPNGESELDIGVLATKQDGHSYSEIKFMISVPIKDYFHVGYRWVIDIVNYDNKANISITKVKRVKQNEKVFKIPEEPSLEELINLIQHLSIVQN
jgi:hypothetical protein